MKAAKKPTRRMVIDNLENLLAILYKDLGDCEAELQRAVERGAYVTKYGYATQVKRLLEYADELEQAITWLNHHEIASE